jgi:hypothetical protein
MGDSGAASGRGRYEEKRGGQQVASLFEEATDNERIKAIYGNYGLWSWLRYWLLDTANYTVMMLADKSYYDYDYEPPKPKRKTVKRKRTKEQTQSLFTRMGFGKVKDIHKSESKPTDSAEDLQRVVMGDIQAKRSGTTNNKSNK